LIGISFLSEKANWILEIVSNKDEITEGKVKKYEKLGYYVDKKMLMTFKLLDKYARFILLNTKK